MSKLRTLTRALADPTQTSTRYRNYVPFWA